MTDSDFKDRHVWVIYCREADKMVVCGVYASRTLALQEALRLLEVDHMTVKVEPYKVTL